MSIERKDLTTLTIFTFERGRRLWPFVAMSRAGARLKRVPGLDFRKMMGAGRGIGFSARPDFGRYALLGVWKSRADAERFLADSPFMNLYRKHASAIDSWYLEPTRSHGQWDGGNPFERSGRLADRTASTTGEVAVMTRATINLRRAGRFWEMVAPVSDELAAAEGLLSSIGVGEVPWVRQATFSVWESEEAMKSFAYGAPVHREVIRRTRAEEWYREDLFVRFSVLEKTHEECRT